MLFDLAKVKADLDMKAESDPTRKNFANMLMLNTNTT